MVPVTKPVQPDSFKAIHASMLNIVCLALDSDPAYIPRAAKSLPMLSPALPYAPRRSPLIPSPTPAIEPLDPALDNIERETVVGQENVRGPADGDLEGDGEDDSIDPDDFTLRDEKHAKRIVAMAEAAFGVDLSTDVVIADANVGALARRVVGARSLVMQSGGRVGP
jgi:phosphatidylethanolamine N-methyltransferase